MTQLRVVLRIPSDDAYELKAQALNNDSRLKGAGIAALKFAEDDKYVVDGDFSPEPESTPSDSVHPPPNPGSASATGTENLHVFIRIPTDDAYELKAQALNGNPQLLGFGIKSLRNVGEKQFISDGEFSPEGPFAKAQFPSPSGPASAVDTGKLHVFLQIPNEDAYELKAQALNGNPQLKSSGVTALRNVGDKKYISDGEFSAHVPSQESNTPSLSGPASAVDAGKLHVFLQIPNEDSYELKAQALNNNPELKQAGITALRHVGDKKYIQDGGFLPKSPSQKAVDTPSDKDRPTKDNVEQLHVFVRLPNDDSNELKAQALNREPALKEAGIKALRRVGDKRYVMDGELTPTIPAKGGPGSEYPEPSTRDRLRVVIRMKDDDAYKLLSIHLNDGTLLEQAGVSHVGMVPGKKSQPAILIPPKKKPRLRSCLEGVALLGVLGALLIAGGAVLAYGSPQAALTQIALISVPEVLTQIAGGPPSATPTPVPSATVTPSITPTPTKTVTPTRTPTRTRTPTPSQSPTVTATLEVLFTASKNTFCRVGPSTTFTDTAGLVAGDSAPILGYSFSTQDGVSIWWQVLVNGRKCYVSETAGTANITPAQATFIPPPASSTTGTPFFSATSTP